MYALYCSSNKFQMRIHRLFHAKKRYASIAEWYQTPLGLFLFDELREKLEPTLTTSFGYYAMQIGCVSEQQQLLEGCRVKHHFRLDRTGKAADLHGKSALLPIANDSVDLVVLMHHLSATEAPHALLREVSRILIPQGKLIIVDFNPLSLWGLRHFFQSWLEQLPWSGHFYTARRLTDWMQLLGFDRTKHLKVGYLPPLQQPRVLKHLSWLEKGMRKWLSFSSALNVMVFDKNITPITPVRHRWVTRKILPGKVAPPTVGRNMKYNRKS